MPLDNITELFLMEAKEHLETLENGLVNLQATMEDPENIKEMFRAAHSVKGGAAMLGFDSIRTTSHRLEDCFKILRDETISQIDQTSESMFLKGVDTLKDLLEKLEGPFGLRPEEGEELVQGIMPVFAELEQHLNDLVNGKISPETQPTTVATQAPPPANIVPQVRELLQEILDLFRQTESPSTRKKVQGVCDRLLQLNPSIAPWQSLVNAVKKAVGNSQASYKILAPLVVKEIKEAADLIQEGKTTGINPSQVLQQLAAGGSPPPPKQLTITTETQVVAQVLIQNFNRRELAEITKLLVQHIKGS